MKKNSSGSSKPAANHPWRSGVKKKPTAKGAKRGKSAC